MTVDCERETFVDAISDVVGTLDDRSLDASGHILFVARKDTLTLSSRDAALSLRRRTEAGIVAEGKACLPSAPLKSLLRLLSADTVSITSTDSGGATVKNGRTVWTLDGLPPDAMPPLPAPAHREYDHLAAGAFANALSSVTYAAAHGAAAEGAEALSGVYLQFTGTGVTAVATDRYRLAIHTAGEAPTEGREVVIPLRAAEQLQRRLSAVPDANVTVTADERRFFAACGGWDMSSALIAAPFPNWRKVGVLPENPEISFVVDTHEMRQGLRRAGYIASKEHNLVGMTLGVDHVILDARSQGTGDVLDEIPVTEAQGVGVRFRLNYRYLMEAIEAIGTTKLRFHLASASRPVFLTSDEEPGMVHLVTPVVTKESV